ncbi:MAG: hypothetical protein MHM6MM_005918 [Cercozoa sp. M6MM]
MSNLFVWALVSAELACAARSQTDRAPSSGPIQAEAVSTSGVLAARELTTPLLGDVDVFGDAPKSASRSPSISDDDAESLASPKPAYQRMLVGGFQGDMNEASGSDSLPKNTRRCWRLNCAFCLCCYRGLFAFDGKTKRTAEDADTRSKSTELELRVPT